MLALCSGAIKARYLVCNLWVFAHLFEAFLGFLWAFTNTYCSTWLHFLFSQFCSIFFKVTPLPHEDSCRQVKKRLRGRVTCRHPLLIAHARIKWGMCRSFQNASHVGGDWREESNRSGDVPTVTVLDVLRAGGSRSAKVADISCLAMGLVVIESANYSFIRRQGMRISINRQRSIAESEVKPLLMR